MRYKKPRLMKVMVTLLDGSPAPFGRDLEAAASSTRQTFGGTIVDGLCI
jgi:hypothetical protein